MSKIDTTKIEGYNEMTAEQKIAALEAYETKDPDYAGYVKKDIFDRTSSELANVKKQLRAKMSEDEQKSRDEAEQREKLEKDYNDLLKKVTISEHKNQFLALGYNDHLAGETAEALVNGDMTTVFTNQKKHLETMEKKIRADVLKETPKPDGGNGGNEVDYRKKIEEARLNGDMSLVAYYTRLASQESINI